MAHTPPEDVLSHWSTLIENFSVAPSQFYDAVESSLQRRQIPDTTNERITFKEAGLMSAERVYLHVRKEKLVFDICAAPFGTGFFFSWWFAEERPYLNPGLKVLALFAIFLVPAWMAIETGIAFAAFFTLVVIAIGFIAASEMSSSGQFDDGPIRALPLLGKLYEWLFRPGTYYRLDSMEMYQNAVHNAVAEVIDQMTTAKGLRILSADERKPVMQQFYGRRK
jgi:hypothetical protein